MSSNTTVPSAEVQPTTNIGQSVELTVPSGYAWFFVENPTDQVNSILYDELSWDDPEAKYSDEYKRGVWDGVHRLYRYGEHAAPVGLLEKAVTVLEDAGYDVEITIEGDRSGDEIDTQWAFGHQLREYQTEAVKQTLEASGGVISLPTGAGKTVVALKLIHTLGQRALVCVHTQELLYQWADRVRDILGVDPGLVGDDNWSEGAVTIATMQTLHSRGLDSLEASYGMLVFDECHRTSAAETMQAVGLDIDVEWRIGLSATPWRNVDGEELEIEAATGGTAFEVHADTLIEKGYLAEPKFEFVDEDSHRQPYYDEDYWDVIRRCIELAPCRNHSVAKKAGELADRGHQVLVTVDRLNQGRLLEYALNDSLDEQSTLSSICDDQAEANRNMTKRKAVYQLEKAGGYDVAFLCGSDNRARRDKVLSQFQNGEISILITTLLKEGADIPEISSIVLAGGGKSKRVQIQRIGRALRPSNGAHAVIADVRDRGHYIGDHFEERFSGFQEYYGEYGPADL